MTVAGAWEQAYAADPKGILAGWKAILGPVSYPRDVLIQLPKSKRKGEDVAVQGRYDQTVKTFQDYAKLLLENAPRRDCWVSWGMPRDYDAFAMSWAFGDVDSEVPEEALRRARKYEDFVVDTFEVQPPALYTAGKGFHLHLTHDEVPYRGKAYADTLTRLSDDYRVYLDQGPLKHRKAKPRVPYSINLKATGKHQEPRFVVPVDLTWDLKDIQRASRECQIMPFKVPHSKVAAGVIEPIAAKVQAKLEAQAKRRIALGKTGVDLQGIKDAVLFCEENGPVMVNKLGRPDGRKRLLYAVYVPALLHLHKGDQGAVLEACKAWVQACGGAWSAYLPLVRSTMKSCFLKDGDMLRPMSIPRWLSENPGLRFPH